MAEERILKNLMTMFHDVRRELATACPGLGLKVDFPIKQGTSMRGYHGCCDVAYGGWDSKGCRASTINVRSLTMVVREQPLAQRSCTPCDKKMQKPGRILPVEILLCTFIHELAHTVTHGERKRRDEVSRDTLKLQPEDAVRRGHKKASAKEMLTVHHSQTFYKNFATLLRAAEKLKIYALPAVRNKFSPRNLMRFDSIDLGMHMKGFHVGHSPRFSRCPDLRARRPDVNHDKPSPTRVVLVAVCKGVRKCKPVLVMPVDMTVSRLLQLARSKLRLSKAQAGQLWSESEQWISCDAELRDHDATSAKDVVLIVKPQSSTSESMLS